MTASCHFLFLQGPHGPFFRLFGDFLKTKGHQVSRINFNGGDHLNWPEGIDFSAPFQEWAPFLNNFVDQHKITDICLYSDCRPYHATAIDQAKKKGLRVHVFEEGYLRPHWITYERDGVNANSPYFGKLEHIVQNPQEDARPATPYRAPKFRRTLYQCLRYYTGFFLYSNRFKNYTTHRKYNPLEEIVAWIKYIFKAPFHKLKDNSTTFTILDLKSPFYVLILQLDTDFQIRTHSSFLSMSQVIEHVISSFAIHAPHDTSLVIKNHPLDSGRVDYPSLIHDLSRKYGCEGRVLYLYKGKLGPILEKTQGVVGVNSTAGLHAIFQGVPTKVLGRALYDVPGITFQDDLNMFWTGDKTIDRERVERLVHFLKSRTQYNGSYYAPETFEGLFNSLYKVMRDTSS